VSDKLFQSNTFLGKNEYFYKSGRQDILMNVCLDADFVDLVERVSWSIGQSSVRT